MKHSKLEGEICITTIWRRIGYVLSGGGKIIFLEGNNEKVAPLAWSCNKIRRVCNNTLSAEKLIAYDTLSHAIYLRAMVAEILGINPRTIPIRLFSDSKNMTEYRVRERGCSLTHSARTPPSVHPGITIWVDEIEIEKKSFFLFLNEIELEKN